MNVIYNSHQTANQVFDHYVHSSNHSVVTMNLEKPKGYAEVAGILIPSSYNAITISGPPDTPIDLSFWNENRFYLWKDSCGNWHWQFNHKHGRRICWSDLAVDEHQCRNEVCLLQQTHSKDSLLICDSETSETFSVESSTVAFLVIQS